MFEDGKILGLFLINESLVDLKRVEVDLTKKSKR